MTQSVVRKIRTMRKIAMQQTMRTVSHPTEMDVLQSQWSTKPLLTLIHELDGRVASCELLHGWAVQDLLSAIWAPAAHWEMLAPPRWPRSTLAEAATNYVTGEPPASQRYSLCSRQDWLGKQYTNILVYQYLLLQTNMISMSTNAFIAGKLEQLMSIGLHISYFVYHWSFIYTELVLDVFFWYSFFEVVLWRLIWLLGDSHSSTFLKESVPFLTFLNINNKRRCIISLTLHSRLHQN